MNSGLWPCAALWAAAVFGRTISTGEPQQGAGGANPFNILLIVAGALGISALSRYISRRNRRK